MKQTAIEWLEKSISLLVERCDLQKVFEEAKEMEKQQIVDCWNKKCKIDGVLTFTDNRTGEEYYNETFKK
jgi:hypothetical protein